MHGSRSVDQYSHPDENNAQKLRHYRDNQDDLINPYSSRGALEFQMHCDGKGSARYWPKSKYQEPRPWYAIQAIVSRVNQYSARPVPKQRQSQESRLYCHGSKDVLLHSLQNIYLLIGRMNGQRTAPARLIHFFPVHFTKYHRRLLRIVSRIQVWRQATATSQNAQVGIL